MVHTISPWIVKVSRHIHLCSDAHKDKIWTRSYHVKSMRKVYEKNVNYVILYTLFSHALHSFLEACI